MEPLAPTALANTSPAELTSARLTHNLTPKAYIPMFLLLDMSQSASEEIIRYNKSQINKTKQFLKILIKLIKL